MLVVYVCSLDQGRAAMLTGLSLNYKSNQIKPSAVHGQNHNIAMYIVTSMQAFIAVEQLRQTLFILVNLHHWLMDLSGHMHYRFKIRDATHNELLAKIMNSTNSW